MKKSLFSLAVVSLLSADTTMCFKENWTDMSKIETIALAGGKCESKYSVEDMKAQGWSVDDIKVSSGKMGMNYMYIFKKGTSLAFQGKNSDEISEEIYAKVEQRILAKQEKVKKQKIAKKKAEDKARGEKLYKTTCARCHGANASLEAYNTARALNTLSQDEFLSALSDYDSKVQRGSNSFLMYDIAASIGSSDAKKIYSYIQTLK